MKTVSWSAVLLGNVADFAARTLFAIGTLLLVHIHLHVKPADPRIHAFYQTAFMHIANILIGLTASGFGGYVAGRVAKRRFVLHGLLSAVGTLFLTAIVLTSSRYRNNSDPVWYSVLVELCALLSASMCGLLAKHARKISLA